MYFVMIVKCTELRGFVNAIPSSLDVAYAPVSLSTSSFSNASEISAPSMKSREKASYPITPYIEVMIKYATNHSDTTTIREHVLGTSCARPQAAILCKDCGVRIHVGEVIVKAARAGKEISWHPGCFKCVICRELLADLVYFFQFGQLYCGRDLAVTLNIPRCKACDELIFTKEYTAAEGCTFHIKHFCCFQCDIPLAGLQYVPDEKTNMPLCLHCYEQYYAASCQNCHLPISPTDEGVAWTEITGIPYVLCVPTKTVKTL